MMHFPIVLLPKSEHAHEWTLNTHLSNALCTICIHNRYVYMIICMYVCRWNVNTCISCLTFYMYEYTACKYWRAMYSYLRCQRNLEVQRYVNTKLVS